MSGQPSPPNVDHIKDLMAAAQDTALPRELRQAAAAGLMRELGLGASPPTMTATEALVRQRAMQRQARLVGQFFGKQAPTPPSYPKHPPKPKPTVGEQAVLILALQAEIKELKAENEVLRLAADSPMKNRVATAILATPIALAVLVAIILVVINL